MPQKSKRPATTSKARKPAPDVRGIDTVSTLKDLRKTTHHTQEDLALALGVGQGTVSRIEKRQDMLVSTLQHYVESIGGTLQLLVTFPDRPPVRVERLGKKPGASTVVPGQPKTGVGRPAQD